MQDRASDTAIAMAALSICENMLAVLMDRNLLNRTDVEELLTDAAQVQENSAPDSEDAQANRQAAALIRQVIDGLGEHGPSGTA